MEHIKILHTILVGLLAPMLLSAQSNVDLASLDFIGRECVPPTPSSYVFRKYMASQPSLATGAVRVDIPVYEISHKGLSIPISLKYLSNGIKVFDSPYPCGYGWSLHPGMRITRLIVGRPDEHFNHIGQAVTGSTMSYDEARRCQININNLSQTETVYDSGHDIFYIHLPGGDYTRMIDKTDAGIEFVGPDNELKITADNSLTTINVTDSRGVEYVFGACYESIEGAEFVTSWMLQQIILPFGDTVTVAWHRITNYATHRRHFGFVALNDRVSINPASCEMTLYENVNRINSRPYIDPHAYCYAPASIVWPAGRVDFTYTTLASGDFLTGISVKDHTGASVKACSLSYDQTRGRLLEKVNLSDEGKYSFSYNPQSFVSDNAQDWWGYYNGMTSNSSLVPRLQIKTYHQAGTAGYYLPSPFGDADRSVDVTAMQANILTRVVYPTGGASSFEYEPHHFDLPSGITSSEIHPSYDVTPDVGGGLRVKRIMTTAADGTPPIQKTYVYGTGESGKAVCRSVPSPKTFVAICTAPSTSYRQGVSNDGYSFDYRRVTISATSSHDNFAMGETNIWYPEVAEYSDGSKTVYQFAEIGSPNHYDCPQGSAIYERVPVNIHRAASSGPALVSETRYSRQGDGYAAVSSVTRQYSMLSDAPQVTDWYIRYRTKNTMISYSPDFPPTNYMSGQYATTQSGNYIIRWDYEDMYARSIYHVDLAVERLVSQQTTIYTPGGSASLNQSFTYVPGTSIVRQTVTSDGHDTRTRTVSYPSCHDSGADLIEPLPVYQAMAARNMIAVPVASKDSVEGCVMLSQGIFSPVGTGYAVTSMKIKKGSTEKSIGTLGYSTDGNLISCAALGKPAYSLQWDNRGLYPVKKTLAGADSQSGLSWTYTHKPLVGLSSVTDPAGVKTVYSYDTRGRLSSVSVTGHGMVTMYEYGVASDIAGWDSQTEAGTGNYTREMEALDDAGSAAVTRCTYFDGLGRPWQEVAEGAPGIAGVSRMTDHDAESRVSRSWLSVPAAAGAYASRADFAQGARAYYSDQYPFTCYGYGLRQGESPDTVRRPGAYLQLSAAPSTHSLAVNSAQGRLGCMEFKVTASGSLHRCGRYPSQTLLVETSVNEDGQERLVFTNLFGQKVLERSVIDTGAYADTYYVYDGYGLLRYVITPKASETLASSALSAYWSYTSGVVDKLCYYYEYNTEGAVTVRKLPGCEKTTYVYDNNGVLIFSQDGNQRASGQWTLTIPDVMLRPCITGVVSLSSFYAGVYARYSPRAYRTSAISAFPGYIIRKDGLPSSNITNSFSNSTADVVAYYDDYSFLNAIGIDNADDYAFDAAGSAQCHSSAAGRMTGRLISGRPEVTYYDLMGNATQVAALNPFGFIDRRSSTYTHAGQPLHSETCHKRSVAHAYTERHDYVYDALGRLSSLTHQIDNDRPRLLAAYRYNDLGQVGSMDTADGNYGIENSYDMHGRLCQIQSDSFNLSLMFEGSGPSAAGNINSCQWDYGSGAPRTMTYAYDRLNRLVSSGMPSECAFLTQYEYDRNSNPTHIKRYGLADRTGSGLEMGVIDDVAFVYDGNQMSSATDAAGELTYYGANDFESGDSAYTWDANGNMASDSGRGINAVEYNRFNLPTSVDMGSLGSVTYTYDGTGRKLSQTCLLNTVPLHAGAQSEEMQGPSRVGPIGPIGQLTTILYHDNYIYRNANLQILIPGGYITRQNSAFTYHYYIVDHQNNVRAVIDESGNVEETNDYYPYGMLMAAADGTIPSVQPYKYAGKEHEIFAGMNTYDYGPRRLSPSKIIFTSPDLLCEENYQISPYVYCVGNPVNYIDPTGLSTNVVINEDKTYSVIGGDLKDDDLNIYVCTNENGKTKRLWAIGTTPVISSFYNSDANNGNGSWMVGAIINPNDKSGINFINNIVTNTPSNLNYALNGYGGKLYDYKVSNGTEDLDDDHQNKFEHYRGVLMGRTSDGMPIYTSARDLGNIVAGYVIGYNAIPLGIGRFFFDVLQSVQDLRFSTEGFSSQNAQKYGYKWGLNIQKQHLHNSAPNIIPYSLLIP